MIQATLAATVHDPDGRFQSILRAVASNLGLYAAIAIAATENTSADLLTTLREMGARVTIVPRGAAGEARRRAVFSAIQLSTSPVFSCDFDRWLHWAMHYPDELAEIPVRVSQIKPAPWYVCIGRTGRAFATHPRAQREPEAATNHALELAQGSPIDAVAGAAWLSHEAVELILAHSIESTAATDLEWPALVLQANPGGVAFLPTEGLEFETATFFAEEVRAAGGRDAWIERLYETPAVWSQRLRLAADSTAALTRVLKEQ